jgi:hypothetical protein
MEICMDMNWFLTGGILGLVLCFNVIVLLRLKLLERNTNIIMATVNPGKVNRETGKLTEL